MSIIEKRREQIFPVLDAAQIETAKRFASGPQRDVRAGRGGVRRRRAQCARLARAQGLDRRGAARRPQARDADHDASCRANLRRGEPARWARDARLRQGRRRRLHGVAVRRRAYPRADDRLGGSRRDRHARLHPAPRRADRRRRRRLGAGRHSRHGGAVAAAGFSPPQRLSRIPCSTPPTMRKAAPWSSASACRRRTCR